jgi:hypothetical protein
MFFCYLHLSFFNPHAKKDWRASKILDTDLGETAKYSRDECAGILKFGFTASFVIWGWLVSYDKYDLGREPRSDEFGSTVALIVLSAIFWGAWSKILFRVHDKCPEHPTVIPKETLYKHAYTHIYTQALAIVLAVRN